ncbi:hypothetical protein NKR19_g1105 [Coniochaeta hoffmannii]|uniref:Uncharacterized protein n=1 Tax=Coniochaeta hoffmannii TaxID=91930 RepID=A0AA38W137_9PEZI|nr:hypothetical protein NKR19_g1105 [Coniochaeta hoffmannii]
MVAKTLILALALAAGALATPIDVRDSYVQGSNILDAVDPTDAEAFTQHGVTLEGPSSNKKREGTMFGYFGVSPVSWLSPDQKTSATHEGHTGVSSPIKEVSKPDKKVQNKHKDGNGRQHGAHGGHGDKEESKEEKEHHSSETNYGQDSYGADSKEEHKPEHKSETKDEHNYGQNSYGGEAKDDKPSGETKEEHGSSEHNYGQNSYGTESNGEQTQSSEPKEQHGPETNYGQSSYGGETKGEHEQGGHGGHGGPSGEEHQQIQHEDEEEADHCDAEQSKEEEHKQEEHKQEENHGQNSYGTGSQEEQPKEKENYGQNSYGGPSAAAEEQPATQEGPRYPAGNATEATGGKPTETKGEAKKPSTVQVAGTPGTHRVDVQAVLALMVAVAMATYFL